MTTPLAAIDWPEEFCPSAIVWGSRTGRTAWTSPYTGQIQSISYAADSWLVNVSLPPLVRDDAAGKREAFFAQAASSGRILRLYHFARPIPHGTLRGSPVTTTTVAAGVREIEIEGTTGATLVGGDMIKIGNQLLMVAYQGATFSGTPGRAMVPLVMPLRAPITAGAAVTWDKPRADFKLLNLEVTASYAPGRIQLGLDLALAEQY